MLDERRALSTRQSDPSVSRRGFLKRAAVVIGGLTLSSGLLQACTSQSASSPTSPPAAEPTKAAAPAAPATQAPAAQATQAPAPKTTQAPAAATAKKTLTIAQGGEISKLDPHLSTASLDIAVSFNLFDNLVSRHVDGKFYPSLATEWKTLNDTTWEFKLRKDVKFHNGDPLTSEDVKFSIERTYDPAAKTLVATVFPTIDQIETPDPYTVKFNLKQPDLLLPARFSFYGGQIIPKKYFNQVGAETFNQKPIGSGPVKFVEWVKDDHLLLEANPDYWGGKIIVDKVVFKPIPEVATRMGALQKGEADIITKVLPDQVAKVKAMDDARHEGALYAGLYVLGVNSKVKPLDRKEIKQALSLAIDREAIVKELWDSQGIVPNGPIAKGDFAWDEKRPTLKYDPDKAKELLRSGGYAGEEIIIQSSTVINNDKQMSEALQSMWQQIGVKTKIEQIEASVRAQHNRERNFKGVWWSDPTSALGDPDGMMWRLLAPGGIMDYWRDPRFDDLGKKARVSLDPKFREDAYREMSDLILEWNPWIVVIQPIESYGVANWLDWKPYSNQQIELRTFALKAK